MVTFRIGSSTEAVELDGPIKCIYGRMQGYVQRVETNITLRVNHMEVAVLVEESSFERTFLPLSM